LKNAVEFFGVCFLSSVSPLAWHEVIQNQKQGRKLTTNSQKQLLFFMRNSLSQHSLVLQNAKQKLPESRASLPHCAYLPPAASSSWSWCQAAAPAYDTFLL